MHSPTPGTSDGASKMGWEHFPHGSDIGVRGFGTSLEEAFEHAGVGLTAVVGDVSTVRPLESVEVRCNAPDHELLLVSWLNAIIYEMATRSMLFSRFRVRLTECTLVGTLSGESVDPDRHRLAVEAKGATFTALKVVRQDDRWVAQCVIDV